MTTKLKLIRGKGKRTVKWSHAIHKPDHRHPGSPRFIQAGAPNEPFYLELWLYETPVPEVKP